MKLHTLYFSPTGTTETVVENIAQRFDEQVYYDLTLPQNRQKSLSFAVDDVLLIGVPVYSGRIPKLMDQWLYQLEGKGQRCIVVVVYGNRAYDDALLELRNRMVEQNFKPIAAGAFIGEHSYTSKVGHLRPDGRDLQVCDLFYEQIDLNRKAIIEVPGNVPYRPLKAQDHIGPKTLDRCLNCGLCAIKCPTGALQYNKNMSVNTKACIKCHACIKACPMLAISFNTQLDQAINWLEEHAFLRKEPELFV